MKYHPSVFGLSKRLWLYAPIPGIIAAAVYSLTLARGVTPGAAAVLTAAAVGLTPPSGESHPFFAWTARAVASWDVFALPIRMGLFSTFCAVLSAVLFYRLASDSVFGVRGRTSQRNGLRSFRVDGRRSVARRDPTQPTRVPDRGLERLIGRVRSYVSRTDLDSRHPAGPRIFRPAVGAYLRLSLADS